MSLPKLNYRNGLAVAIFIILQMVFFHDVIAQAPEVKSNQDLELLAEFYLNQSNYDSAIIIFNQLKTLANKTSKWNHEIEYSLKIIETYRNQEKFNEIDSCLALIETSNKFDLKDFPLLNATVLHHKGTSLGLQGNFTIAIEYLDESSKLRLENSHPYDSALAITYNNMGAYYYYLGDIGQSLLYYEEAIRIASMQDKQDDELASYIQNVGIIYARMGDYERALINFDRTLSIRTEILDPDDPGIANIYLNLGLLYSLLSRNMEALEFNDLAQKIYIKKFGSDYSALGTIYLNKSRIYINLADYEEAVKYLNNALSIYQASHGAEHPDIARIYNNLGLVFQTQKEFPMALEYFQKSLKIQKDTDSRSILLRNIANVYAKMGDIEEAGSTYKESLQYTLKELGETHPEYGNSLRSYSSFLLDLGELSEVEAYIQKALENYLLHFSERNTNVSELYILYGQYQFAIKSYHLALEYFQKAMISNDFVYDNADVFQNANVNNVISKLTMLSILLEKAKTFSKIYNERSDEKYLNTALNCYEEAMPIFQQLRSELKYDSKFILMDKTSRHFNNAYSDYFLNYENEKDEEALNKTFEFTEKNKAAVLLSSMKNMDAMKFGGIPEEYQNFERQLKERISGYENLIYDQKELKNPDSSRIVLWDKRLFDLTNQYDSLIEVFGEKYPSYYDLKYDNKVNSVSDVQREISDDDVIIEYTLTDSSLYAFLISKEQSSYYKILIDSSFNENLSVIQHTAKFDYQNHNLDDFKIYVNASFNIYQVLFSKFEDEIIGKKLIIIPDGKLGYLAFESLVTSLPDMQSINYRNLDYLIKSYPISYSYSSTLLFKNNVSKTSGNEVLAFAPSYVLSDEKDENKSVLRQVTNNLKPLINAQEEVANVIDVFRGEIFNNEEATESNFKLNSGNYDVLHLAMHTIINDEDPMYSKMVFSMEDDSENDGYLNTFEIYNLNLKAQLAVLSACNTGSGKILNGEGIMSLARGFIYAGVPSIVMTLWEVDDKSGADIMTNFYTYLKNGQSKDVALQNAKIKYLSSASQLRAHPYFWSAYVNVGNSKPLRLNNKPNYFIYSGIFLLMISAIIVILRRKQKKATQ